MLQVLQHTHVVGIFFRALQSSGYLMTVHVEAHHFTVFVVYSRQNATGARATITWGFDGIGRRVPGWRNVSLVPAFTTFTGGKRSTTACKHANCVTARARAPAGLYYIYRRTAEDG